MKQASGIGQQASGRRRLHDKSKEAQGSEPGKKGKKKVISKK